MRSAPLAVIFTRIEVSISPNLFTLIPMLYLHAGLTLLSTICTNGLPLLICFFPSVQISFYTGSGIAGFFTSQTSSSEKQGVVVSSILGKLSPLHAPSKQGKKEGIIINSLSFYAGLEIKQFSSPVQAVFTWLSPTGEQRSAYTLCSPSSFSPCG